ncbi:hypothetical protein [Myxococcus sp. AB025B]|uniref:hypothetical protein n=1 Tax=Myxococcus sp. AB025B TaxID=2562794 RepID=UPI001E488108|nr:hypothetical protein [Myxococcus sp. AB025B]
MSWRAWGTKPLPSMSEFLAPMPLAAVVLMAVNDRVLKPTFHNTLTGKLSDMAICFFLPLYVSALLALGTRWSLRVRLGVGALVTTGLFTALKVSQPFADLFCEWLRPIGAPLGLSGFRAVADVSDLLTLPFVVLAVLYGRATLLSRAPAVALTPPGAPP